MANSNFRKGLKKLMLKASKASPTICVVVGSVSLVGAVASAVVCTVKSADDILDAHQERIGKIKKCEELAKAGEVEFSENDKIGNLVRAYGSLSVDILKKFWIPMGLTAASLIAFLCGHGIMRKRYAGVLATASLVTEAFNKYRGRVKDTLGESYDKAFMYGGTVESVTVYSEDENGKKTKEKADVWVPSDEVESPLDPRCSMYAVEFDSRSRAYMKEQSGNLTWLNALTAQLNMELHSTGYLFLFDVYKRLDVVDQLTTEQLQASHVVGWLDDGDGDCTIDMGVLSAWNKKALRSEPYRCAEALILDFNVDGVIWNKIC